MTTSWTRMTVRALVFQLMIAALVYAAFESAFAAIVTVAVFYGIIVAVGCRWDWVFIPGVTRVFSIFVVLDLCFAAYLF